MRGGAEAWQTMGVPFALCHRVRCRRACASQGSRAWPVRPALDSRNGAAYDVCGGLPMIEWSEQHEAFRKVVRRFIEAEIKPRHVELEHGELPPYEILRKLLHTLGVDELNRMRYERMLDRGAGSEQKAEPQPSAEASQARADASAMQMILTSELCRWCPGMVTAMGVSMGLTANTILARGTRAQKERWALDLLTLKKIGAWAITEPGSGSDAFGSMQASARRDGDGYVLNGSKTFITNGPYADTIVFVCKLDDGKPIGEFQLIQLKLAKMQVARTNIRNMVFRQLGLLAAGKSMSFEDACACKLYSAQAAMEVCLEAVQLFGGNGYMAEYRVEQLCRDAKVLQIYGGTDEIQISQIARTLLGL